jgi:hypothetical protein
MQLAYGPVQRGPPPPKPPAPPGGAPGPTPPRGGGARRARPRRLERCRLRPAEPGRRVRIRRWSATPLEVPHAGGGFPTVAWRMSGHGRRLVYASDVATLTAELARFARGVDHLVLDGATWRRRIFTHLRIDEDLPHACGWAVGRIAGRPVVSDTAGKILVALVLAGLALMLFGGGWLWN